MKAIRIVLLGVFSIVMLLTSGCGTPQPVRKLRTFTYDTTLIGKTTVVSAARLYEGPPLARTNLAILVLNTNTHAKAGTDYGDKKVYEEGVMLLGVGRPRMQDIVYDALVARDPYILTACQLAPDQYTIVLTYMGTFDAGGGGFTTKGLSLDVQFKAGHIYFVSATRHNDDVNLDIVDMNDGQSVVHGRKAIDVGF